MELLRNQNYKLKLEILEKKLQLQKLMQTSPEVVRPIASTQLQGGFVDVIDNNQEFPRDIPTLDALRMRRNPTTKHPMLPHHFVMSNKGMLEYQSLSISEFVFGYLLVAFCTEFNLFTHICFVLFMIMDLPYICDHQVGYSAGGYSLSPRWFLTWYIYPFFRTSCTDEC